MLQKIHDKTSGNFLKSKNQRKTHNDYAPYKDSTFKA